MVKNLILNDAVIQPRKGKRRLADPESCKRELKNELNQLFLTFEQVIEKANKSLAMHEPESRSRNLEAETLQSCFASCIFKNFENRARWGRYKRLILSLKGYQILFKKLDKFGYPMNFKTVSVTSILNQDQLNLFGETGYTEDPILFFGYVKNKLGAFVEPQIIYIDEGVIQFRLTSDDVDVQKYKTQQFKPSTQSSSEGVKPRLKVNQKAKRAI